MLILMSLYNCLKSSDFLILKQARAQLFSKLPTSMLKSKSFDINKYYIQIELFGPSLSMTYSLPIPSPFYPCLSPLGKRGLISE